jgi:phosphatidylethanolamine-binding protein (PEBP) family uncharacterized protein
MSSTTTRLAVLLGLVLATACSSSDSPAPDSGRSPDGAADAAGRPDAVADRAVSADASGVDLGGVDVAQPDASSPDAAVLADGAVSPADASAPDAPADVAAATPPDASAPDAAVAPDAGPPDASPDVAPEVAPPGAFAVTAPWVDAAMIDPSYTCAGGQHFPAFSWTAGPAGTMSYALVFFDTANNVVHLALTSIPTSVLSLPPIPAGSQFGPESNATDTTWPGPCPNGAQHLYRLTVYALSTPTYTGPRTTDNDVRNSLDDDSNTQVLARAVLTGTSSAIEP